MSTFTKCSKIPEGSKVSIVFFLFSFVFTSLYPQTSGIKISAGADQFVNFEKSQTAILKGSTVGKTAVEWTCLTNAPVKFKNATNAETEVTFPRPGYYLFGLSAKGNNTITDTVIYNVFKPNSYIERLNDMVSLMTEEEKIKQLVNESAAIPGLKIPKYNYWSEALHGILAPNATSFPQSVAMGSTWDPELINRIASAISDEARVKNKKDGKGLSYWSPTVNIARDPRWGRNEESYSEDPYLLSRMGVAFVKGLQGDHPYYLKTISTPKHFIANNEEIRRHNGSSEVDMRNMWEYYIPAFKSTIVEGKAYSIMGAYNRFNGVPCNGNHFLMTDLLRRSWGFEGYVVSDCGAIDDMVYGHHFYKTLAEASARGILAGCDLNCGDTYTKSLNEALEKGYLCIKDIDQAVTRVLSARFRLGEFDPAEIVPYSNIPEEKLDSKENRDLALEAAQKSIVLLKNNNALPIDKNKVKTIAVLGPNAAECELGIYSGIPNITISPLDGIKKRASELGIKVLYEKGCELGGGSMNPIENKYFKEIAGTGKKGLTGNYFNNANLTGNPVVTRVDTVIDFSFTKEPAPGLPEDNFSIRWTGKIIAPETRTYMIGTRTDDGARLWVDGKQLVDDWTNHGEKPSWGKIDLEAGKEYDVVFEHFDGGMGAAARLTWDYGEQNMEPAKLAAKNADAVVMVLGTRPILSQEEFDRMDISLPEIQRIMVQEISKVNPNIIIVLINGGPVAMLGTENLATAIVEGWYTGQSTGTALASVLFGDFNPGGRLPVTFYSSTDQLPPFADYDIINNPRTYMYFEKPVLFPFGHGLSYTTFQYSNLTINSKKLKKDGIAEVTFTIKNSGKVKGDEVVQVYVKDMEASVKVPIRKLRSFQRLTLAPEESKTLTFKIPVSELGFYDIDKNDFKVEPGEFEVQVGSSSQDIRLNDKFMVE